MKLFSWLQDQSNPTQSDSPGEAAISPILEARLAELEKISVRDAMIPRSVMKALDVDVQLRRVRRLKSSKTVYFPVYKGDLDHILGWISKQKVLDLMNDAGEEARLSEHLRPVGVVDETATVGELADAFLKSASPFLIVKNAQGSTSGMVPLSEFVELVFGFELAQPAQTPSTDFSAPLHGSFEL